MVKSAILILCFVEILLSVAGVLSIFPWVNAIDMIHNHSEYMSEKEKNKYVNKEKIYGTILTVIATLFGICILSIIVLAFLV
jgi:small neutral amino acid transporter SnatA (MarC family)